MGGARAWQTSHLILQKGVVRERVRGVSVLDTLCYRAMNCRGNSPQQSTLAGGLLPGNALYGHQRELGEDPGKYREMETFSEWVNQESMSCKHIAGIMSQSNIQGWLTGISADI